MSAHAYDGSYDSGRNHVWPAVVAVVISAVSIVAAVLIAGMPH